MMIQETLERPCCDARKDLKQMPDAPRNKKWWWFCIHCGRWWMETGGKEPEDSGLVPLQWPWEVKK